MEGRKRYGPVVSFSRFDPGNVAAEGWGYNGKSDALTLTVNKAVLFHGVRLFGNSRGSQYEVKFTVKDKTVTGTYTSQQNDGVWSYDVILSNFIFAKRRVPNNCDNQRTKFLQRWQWETISES